MPRLRFQTQRIIRLFSMEPGFFCLFVFVLFSYGFYTSISLFFFFVISTINILTVTAKDSRDIYSSRVVHIVLTVSSQFWLQLPSFFFLVLPNCGDPGTPSNGIAISRNHWAGAHIRYLCHPGYTMFGPAVRKCLSSANWSGNAPACKSLCKTYSLE